MLPPRPVCCGSLFLSGFLIWKTSVDRKRSGIATKYTGGLYAMKEYEKSPFEIYRNALDFVMSSSSMDEDAAAEVILKELSI